MSPEARVLRMARQSWTLGLLAGRRLNTLLCSITPDTTKLSILIRARFCILVSQISGLPCSSTCRCSWTVYQHNAALRDSLCACPLAQLLPRCRSRYPHHLEAADRYLDIYGLFGAAARSSGDSESRHILWYGHYTRSLGYPKTDNTKC